MRAHLGSATGLALAAALVLTGCGGESADGDDTSAGTSSPSTSTGASGAVEISRTGGIAGVQDAFLVTPAGQAKLTTKDGSIPCEVPAPLLDRLRDIDLDAVDAAPSPDNPVADGFVYTVRIGGAKASGADGDGGRRAELVDAAAAVLTACQQQQPGSY